MGSGTGEIQNADLQKETWGQLDGNSICLQGQRAGSKARARASTIRNRWGKEAAIKID